MVFFLAEVRVFIMIVVGNKKGCATRGMPKLNRKHAQKGQSSYQGKRRSYQVLDNKIIVGCKTAPMIDYFI
jgi:hypothetical protein